MSDPVNQAWRRGLEEERRRRQRNAVQGLILGVLVLMGVWQTIDLLALFVRHSCGA